MKVAAAGSCESSQQIAQTQPGKHILTVSFEDYFHVGAFEGAVRRKHWDRFESRLERNTSEILDLLAKYEIRATFFVLGWIAEKQPEIVTRIAAAGHEIASSGYWPRGLRGMVPDEFRTDLKRSKEVLESAGSNPIIGYRTPRSWLRKEDLWILDILCEEGYVYDSSLNPVLRRFSDDPRRFRVHRHRHSVDERTIWEFPISTASILGLRVAISGGNYIRQLPHTLLKRAVQAWTESEEAPLVFYFMPWEIDRDQPHIKSISAMNRIRHYRNLAKTRWVLEEYFQKYQFQSIGDSLGIARPVRVAADLAQAKQQSSPVLDDVQAAPDAIPVSLVVPLFNEAENVSYLSKTLLELRRRLSSKYRINLSLVDDGSADNTWGELAVRFHGVRDTQVLRHDKNLGVAAAILTGIRSAPTEIVCSIDCDCSYDPNVLEAMIPLSAEADLVTASPYHPQGNVFNVPKWRLFLSKTLSSLYSFLLKDRIHTYTSCCRVYRKSQIVDLNVRHKGFLGVAETLILLKLRGGKIVEYPTVLESRLFGESKMKIARTIWSHFGLLRDLVLRRRALSTVTAEPRASDLGGGDGSASQRDKTPVDRGAAPVETGVHTTERRL